MLWLDDFVAFLRPGELNESLLSTLAEDPHITVVATLDQECYVRKCQTEASAVLRHFETLLLEPWLDTSELQQARSLYSNEPAEAMKQGLGEYFAVSEEAWEKFTTGEDSRPEGYALVRAAVDCNRAGLSRPIPAPLLRQLASHYLRSLRTNLELTDEVYARGLEWAREPISSSISLLHQAVWDDDTAYLPLDYLLGQLEHAQTPIPVYTWNFLIESLGPEEVFTVSATADRQGNSPVAERAYRTVLHSKHPEAAPWAAFKLGELLAARDKMSGAVEAYRQAISFNHDASSPLAAFHLGLLLRDLGDQPGAHQAIQLASVGLQHAQRPIEPKELEATQPALQQVITSGHPDAAPKAAFYLGRLLEARGDVEGARVAFQRAIDSGHVELAPWAAFHLGRLLQSIGEENGARQSFRRAFGTSAYEPALQGRFNHDAAVEDAP